ncbi:MULTISPECIES: hydroxymethylglutaryl-CoA lyase [Glycomyces]|jgi:hydroxymethylglutaryl-CoA lyase|uniref:Hydroxymethylglutaryl-CoA lyase n=2 Tax=Glycomyces TaxID=58113 RepID=A0A9X3PXN5_9ACTN|nr:hydroxymethylglutaryl-CoA lyase [Glycomyces lechevalierae]MDA1387938.1 hydroxymethylglutaryl-CoA lyase [Glycomyces lechevalierae]MDR7339149.1 hydroxymethylglutaryl-CoA lyase [Glycomyces lechevalierae]
MHQPDRVSLREVAPRDGLQNEPPVPTADKIRLIDALSRTGLSRIEAVSFVSPKAVPQMADAAEVWAAVEKHSGIRYSALAPNRRGVERALDAGFSAVEVVVSASETHNRANIGRSVAESLAELPDICSLAREHLASIEVIIATSFGCPFEGDIAPAKVARIVEAAEAAGAGRVAFGDTTGMGTPRRVTELLDAVQGGVGTSLPMLMHFHDTRGTALANLLTALDRGVVEFDASVGGIGGCPFAPGASGNVATEEVVHMLHDMGVETGVDLDALIRTAELAQEIVGRPLESGVLRAGPRTSLTPKP